MAEFLTATDTSAAIEGVIRRAKKELTLISAYVYPRMIYLERLKDAAARGVDITLIFGKRALDDRVLKLFAEVDNLSIHYLHQLHAKCFLNESEAIITSLNLLNGSEEKNREMGVRLTREKDAEAYEDCVHEVRSILSVSNLVHTTRPQARRNGLPDKGHCIRCGTDVRFEPYTPLCNGDYLTWVQYENPDFPEKYCHWCGKERRVTKGAPLCSDCLKAYKECTGRMLDLTRNWL